MPTASALVRVPIALARADGRVRRSRSTASLSRARPASFFDASPAQLSTGVPMSHRLRASGRARFHARAPRSTAEPSSDGSVPASSMSADDGATGKIVIALGVAMLLASSDRTIFAGGSRLSIKSELAMSMKDVALAQSSFLWGYGVTQLAAGAASDKYGGVKVLLGGLAMWSLAVGRHLGGDDERARDGGRGEQVFVRCGERVRASGVGGGRRRARACGTSKRRVVDDFRVVQHRQRSV